MAEKVLINPFPGLRAFEEDEDILFFGREKQIDELLRKLRTSRFLAIIGSSGSGKSSLVKSGLLPSLHSGLMSGVGSQWRIALFRPGNDPIGKLTEAISKDGILRDHQNKEELETNSSINEAILRRSSLGLIEAYKQSGLDKKNNLLILVDQFEELFRFSRYEKDTREGKRDSIAFINLLLKASEQKELPIYVVFTMRSDFLGDCTEFRGLPEAINEGQYLIPRMTREERREAITGPIAVGGATITPALLNRLLNDVGDNPDQLPILQHALMRTWDSWKKKKRPDLPLDIEDYEQIGTITEALSLHAEEAYAELSTEEERQTCEKIFKELTDKGGLLSGIRRPRLLSELSAAAGVSSQLVKKIIEIFRKPGRGFLMPAYPTELNDNTIIDISHESLMRVWTRLIGWLEEEEESAQIYLHLCEAVNLYETGKGGLWRDPELQLALKWKAEQNTNAAWAARYNPYYDKAIFFLEHSKQKRDLEIQHKEELQKQRLRTARRISIVVFVIAIAFLVFAIGAWNLKIAANNARQDAIDQKNAALMEKQRAENNKKAAERAQKSAVEAEVVAVAAKDSAEKSKIKAIAEEKNALVQKGRAETETRIAEAAKNDAVQSAKIADENKNEAVASKEDAIKSRLQALSEKMEAERLQRVAESKIDAHKAILSINDSDYQKCRAYALQAYDNNLNNKGSFQDNDIYNALDLSWENSIDYKNEFNHQNSPVRSIVGIPHTDYLFSGDENGKIYTLEYNHGILIKKSDLSVNEGVRSLVTDAGGSFLLAVLVKQAILFRIKDDKSLTKLASLKFSGNGRHAAFLNKYVLVQSTEGVTRFETDNGFAKIDSVNIPGCSSIAVGNNGHIYIASHHNISDYAGWEHLSSAPSNYFVLPSTITCLCLDKTGKYLAAGTYGGMVWFKDLESGQPESKPGLHRSAVNDLKFCDVMNGRLQLASASSDKTIKLIEVTTAHTLNTDDVITIQDHSHWVYSLFYSSDGKYLFSGSEDQLIIGRPTTMAYLHDNLLNNK
jgi:energy-coupling factor transporter ATP-binding protein EcfA2